MLDFINENYKRKILLILDLVLINLALLISFMIRFEGMISSYIDIRYFYIISIVSLIVLYFSNLYKTIWKYASISELLTIIKTSLVLNILFLITIYFVNLAIPRSVILINFMTIIILMGGFRFTLRIIKEYSIRRNTSKSNKRLKALIVGAGDAGEIIVREMNKHHELDIEIIGLIDDDPAKQNLKIHGYPVLGTTKDIPKLIKKYDIYEVIIAIPSADGSTIRKIYELSNQKSVGVKIVPGVFEILNGDVDLIQIRDVKVNDLLKREPVDLKAEKITEYITEKTVLVTGGSGSIGSELCRQIAQFNPKQLIILDINENSIYFIKLELENKYPNLNFETIVGSIRDQDKLEQVFKHYQPDVVFHAAAHKHVPLMEDSPEEAVKNNILGTKKLVEKADKFMVKRFVFISTDKAVNPTNVMGASKRVAEMIIQHFNSKSKTKFMAVRFGNVLGSKGSVIPIFKKQIENGGPITVTHAEIKRYFMTIPEAAQLVIQAGTLGNGGEVFVLDMGKPVKIIDLAEDLIRLSGLKPYEDIDINIIGLRPGEKLYEELLVKNEKSIPTKHERIFINDLEIVESKKLINKVEMLKEAAAKGDRNQIITILVSLLNNYQPQRDNITKINFKNHLQKIQE